MGETPVSFEYLASTPVEGKNKEETAHPANVMVTDSVVSMKISAVKPVWGVSLLFSLKTILDKDDIEGGIIRCL